MGLSRRARDWPWSAHRALAGLAPAPAFLDVVSAYSHLGEDEDTARLNYHRLVSQSNDALLSDLARPDSDAWMLSAIDDFAIPITDLGTFLRLGRTATYERLAAARRTEGSVPSVRKRVKGTGP